MRALGLIAAAIALFLGHALAVDYTLAVRTLSDELLIKGTLSIPAGDEAGELLFTPAEVATCTSAGCIGVLTSGKQFICHSLFDSGNDSVSWDNLRIWLDNDGGLLHVDATLDGPDLDIIRPETASPMYNPVSRATQKNSNRNDPQYDAEEQEQPPQTFLQKYWVYLLPIAIIVLLNPGGNSGTNSQ